MQQSVTFTTHLFLSAVFWVLWTKSIHTAVSEISGMYYTLMAGITAPFYLLAGSMLVLRKNILSGRKVMLVICALWTVFSAGAVFVHHVLLLAAIGIFSGIWTGHLILQKTRNSRIDIKASLSAVLCGVGLGYLLTIVLTQDIFIAISLPVISLITLLIFAFSKDIALSDSVHPPHQSTSKQQFIFGLLVTFVVLWIVISFSYWHILVPYFKDDIFKWLMIPMISIIWIVLIFLKMNLKKNYLVLFNLSLIASVALGMLYTLNEWMFILLSSLSLGFLMKNFYCNRNLLLYKVWIGYSLCFMAPLFLLMGINADRYATHSKAIQIPEGLIPLSVIQALVKDITLGPGLLVILFGTAFLLRRKPDFH